MVDGTRSWRRRPAGRSRRAAVLTGFGLGAALVAALVAVLAALTLQPSFTRLEQSAVQLVPPDWDSQPPVEIVPRFGAFRRSYAVAFEPGVPPAAARAEVAQRAATLGWQEVEGGGTALTLRRSGVVARVSLDPAQVVTSLASTVGTIQFVAVLGVALLAGSAVPVLLVRRWRRQPRPVS